MADSRLNAVIMDSRWISTPNLCAIYEVLNREMCYCVDDKLDSLQEMRDACVAQLCRRLQRGIEFEASVADLLEVSSREAADG